MFLGAMVVRPAVPNLELAFVSNDNKDGYRIETVAFPLKKEVGDPHLIVLLLVEVQSPCVLSSRFPQLSSMCGLTVLEH